MTVVTAGIVGYYYRYAMIGKWQAYQHKFVPEEIWKKKAIEDKRFNEFLMQTLWIQKFLRSNSRKEC